MNLEPDKEAIFSEVAELLTSGYALTTRDIGSVMLNHGYESWGHAPRLMASEYGKRLLARDGVAIKVHRYRRRLIYVDGRIPLPDTDIEDVKTAICQVDAKTGEWTSELARRRREER